MAIFNYKARDKKGRLVDGMVDAISQEAVANLLSEKDLAVIDISKRNVADLENYKVNFFRKVKQKDLVFFFRQLSVMIDANMPIVRSLKILTRQTANTYFKAIISSVADEVDGGAKLSEAMEDFPDVFGNFYVNMIASGETSGRLSEVMGYLADQQEKDYDLKSKIRGAMIYPAFIVGGLIVVGILVMVFVVPQLTGILQESGVKLPLSTRILIGVSGFFRNYWWQIAIVIVALFSGIVFYVKSGRGRHIFDSLKLKIPIFGKMFQIIYLVRITRSFSTLLKGGVPAAKSLEVVREVVDNNVYKVVLEQTKKDVEEGNAISESLMSTPYIPMIVSQMIDVGEETGHLDDVLDKITDFYSREIDNQVRNLSVLIEPIIMIILGIGIGGFVAAVILPMWQLSSSF